MNRAIVIDVLKMMRGPCDLTPTQRLVLVVLADYGAYDPSVTAIEAATGFNRSTVTRALADLEALEWIARDRKPPRATRYELATTKIRTLADTYLHDPSACKGSLSARGTTPLDDGDARCTEPLEQVHHAPSLGAESSTARCTEPPVSNQVIEATEATSVATDVASVSKPKKAARVKAKKSASPPHPDTQEVARYYIAAWETKYGSKPSEDYAHIAAQAKKLLGKVGTADEAKRRIDNALAYPYGKAKTIRDIAANPDAFISLVTAPIAKGRPAVQPPAPPGQQAWKVATS